MGQPYKNNDIRTAIKQMLNLEQYTDKVPAEIEPKVQLVIDVNPNHNRFTNVIIQQAQNTSGTGTTIYTTPTDKDFYLTSCQYSLVKDATSDAANGYYSITAILGGTTIKLLTFPCLTLTAQQYNQENIFLNPIKLDRGSIIALPSITHTVGNFYRVGSIVGFTVDSNTYDMGILAQQQ